MGGPDIAPQTPQRSGHPGGPGALLEIRRRLGRPMRTEFTRNLPTLRALAERSAAPPGRLTV